jgi:hypothetical protein
VPGQQQTTPQKTDVPIEWQEIRQQSSEALAVRAGKKLKDSELLFVDFSGIRLRMELDRVSLWRGGDVGVKQLIEDFAQYLYLPRMKEPDVLLKAVRDGVARGSGMSALQAGREIRALMDGLSVLVNRD